MVLRLLKLLYVRLIMAVVMLFIYVTALHASFPTGIDIDQGRLIPYAGMTIRLSCVLKGACIRGCLLTMALNCDILAFRTS